MCVVCAIGLFITAPLFSHRFGIYKYFYAYFRTQHVRVCCDFHHAGYQVTICISEWVCHILQDSLELGKANCEKKSYRKHIVNTYLCVRQVEFHHMKNNRVKVTD